MTRARRAAIAFALAVVASCGLVLLLSALMAASDDAWSAAVARGLLGAVLVAGPLRAVRWINSRIEKG